jgi:hypothetical protein
MRERVERYTVSEAAEKLQGVHDWFHDRVRFHIKPYCFFNGNLFSLDITRAYVVH